MLPLVSILCPAYNAERFLSDAIRSVLDQDYPNVELVLGDDCSSDNTVELARGIAAEYPARTVKILANEKNFGITPNCNNILAHCSGEYVCLFAADDVLYPGKISAQVALMQASPGASLCFHGVDVVDNDGRFIATWEDVNSKYRGYSDIVRYGGLPYNSSVMVRRSAIPDGGFDISFPWVSDWLLYVEIAIRGGLLRLDGVYGAYRRHPGGVSRRTFELLEESLRTLEVLQRRYPSREMTEACRIGRRRYLLGEIARSTLAGDRERLGAIRREWGDSATKTVAFVGEVATLFQLHRLGVAKSAFNRISRMVKS